MRKFNLFKEIITADQNSLREAIERGMPFGINIDGLIRYEPFAEKDILIYAGLPDKNAALQDALGRNYQVVPDNGRVLIKAFSNWQEIIGLNTPRATYDDTTADGVDRFSTKEMEDIGWHATEFNISYRELVDELEKRCEGTLICLEQEEPSYLFSGLGFIDDTQKAADVLFEYCRSKIKGLFDEADEFDIDDLSGDELEAAKFFRLI